MPIELADNNSFLLWSDRICDSFEPDALDQCTRGILSHQQLDGGFSGRSGSSDIYYTFFAMAALALLRRPVGAKSLSPYLDAFGPGTELDLVHACCLTRCRDLVLFSNTPEFIQRRLAKSAFAAGIRRQGRSGLKAHITACMEKSNSIYDWYLGLSSLGIAPNKERIEVLLGQGRCPGAGYGAPGTKIGTTTVTAAALSLAHATGIEKRKAADWLLAQKCDGSGFRANPGAQIPDLLSTASAVSALAYSGYDLSGVAADILNFTESCWGPGGQFCASPCEPTEDPEYTFYGLLAIACLLV